MNKYHGHTPGPWRVYLRTRVVANIHHAGMHGSLQDAVADCRDGANAEANAHLVAAAPALLARVEELEGLLHRVKSHMTAGTLDLAAILETEISAALAEKE